MTQNSKNNTRSQYQTYSGDKLRYY